MVTGPAAAVAEPLSEQAAVTDWPVRIFLMLLTAAVVALLLYGMFRGWRARERRQGLRLPEVPPAVAEAAAGLPAAPGSYIGTVLAGRLLERVVAGGTRAGAHVVVGPFGVLVDRKGEPPLFIATDALGAVGTVPGMLQRHFGGHGVLTLDWTWQDTPVTTGLWFADAGTQAAVRDHIARLHLEGIS